MTGKRVFLIFVGFFGVIFAVNGLMAWFAVDTFDGLETQGAYKKGRDYADLSEAAAAQQALGWQVIFDASQTGEALTLTAFDRYGAAVAGASVRATLRRPATDDHDQDIEFRETAPGYFQANLSGLMAGKWLVYVQLSGPGGDVYNLRDTFFVTQTP